MTAYILNKYNALSEITGLISWDICHTSGEPSDSFELEFLYDASILSALKAAVGFKAVHNGKTVFCGRVDEYKISLTEQGRIARINGRGMAALLLDNEAEAAEYQSAGIDFILNRHLTPYGISTLSRDKMKNLNLFTVSTGESEWSVIKRFCMYSAGIMPRFSPDGRLVLTAESSGSTVTYSDTDIISASICDIGYGRISEVLVKNKTAGTSYTAKNQSYVNRGGRARRVMTVPRYAGADAMRYTGEYQIAEAERGKKYVEICVPQLFAAFPADTVKLTCSILGINGSFSVITSRCTADADGYCTYLKLEAKS